MRVVVFGFDNRALIPGDGHSKRWNLRMGQQVSQLDVIVEQRDPSAPRERILAPTVRILPVYVPHPVLYPTVAGCRALAEHRRAPYDLATTDDFFRAGLAGMAFKRLTGVPLSAEYHTETLGNQAWRAERPVIHGVYEQLGHELLAVADSIRCVNEKHRSQLAALARPDLLMEVIPVPVDFYDPALHDEPARAIRRKLVRRPDDVVVLYVGRLVPVKHVEDLLVAFVALRARLPQVVLEVVGDGPERPRLERLARESGIDGIFFSGYIPEQDVYSHYGACDIFVNPAYPEPYGRIYLEAMSAAKPIITTDGVGAVQDGLCLESENCLLIHGGDVAALTEKLSMLCTDAALRRRLGASGQRRVREHFDYARTLQRMRCFWEATVSRGTLTASRRARGMLRSH